MPNVDLLRRGTNVSAIAWLERDYGQLSYFECPRGRVTTTPAGLYEMKPDHPSECGCETDPGSWMARRDAAWWSDR
jgi:hypothetical protein